MNAFILTGCNIFDASIIGASTGDSGAQEVPSHLTPLNHFALLTGKDNTAFPLFLRMVG
jgi:hypothetical protein